MATETINILNRIASPKRKRLDELDNEERSKKRNSTGLAPQNEEDVAIGNETTRLRSRHSTTTLTRPNTNVLEKIKRSGRIYDPPVSPEREVVVPSSTPRQKPKMVKKTRTLNRQKAPQKSPLKGKKFGSIDVRPDVLMRSHNTPAKLNRSKGTNKGKSTLKTVRTPPQQINASQQEDDGEPEETEGVGQREVGFATQSGDTLAQNSTQDRNDSAGIDGGIRKFSVSKEVTTSSQNPEDSTPENVQTQAAITEEVEDLPDDEALNAEIQRQHIKKSKVTKSRRPVQDRARNDNAQLMDEEMEQVADEDERSAGSPAPAQSQRPPQNDEERRARREAEARRWADNVEETERAQVTLSEKRGRKFMDGIADTIARARIGSAELWATLGAAGMEITAMVEKKLVMDTTRAEELNKTLRKLKAIFLENLEPTNDEVDACLTKLQQRASRQHLKSQEQMQRCDPTVVNLFEHIIPQSIRLIKQHLRDRFYEHDKHAWKELKLLVKAAHDLCDTALGWDPKPSILEAGIRGNVHKKIRPSLRQILQYVSEHLRDIEFNEKQDLARREAARTQATAVTRRKNLRAQWDDELERRMSSIASPMIIRTHKARDTDEEPIDIDDIEDEDERQQGIAKTRTPQLLDPWTEIEDIALLNGLQNYLTADRFSLIRNAYSQLRRRTIADCIARAVYYKSRLRQVGQTVGWLQDI